MSAVILILIAISNKGRLHFANMEKDKRKLKLQHGFTVAEALLIVIVLALVAGTGYYAWHKSHKPKAPATQSASTATKTTDANAQVVVSQRKFSALPANLQQAIVTFTEQRASGCVKNGALVDMSGKQTDPEVSYATNDTAIAGIGCDSPAATLFVQQGNSWKEIESTQFAFSCAALKQYEVPASLLVLDQSIGPAQCVSSSNGSLQTYKP
jgi:hypothetical protein